VLEIPHTTQQIAVAEQSMSLISRSLILDCP
jgi:hypothetical protein